MKKAPLLEELLNSLIEYIDLDKSLKNPKTRSLINILSNKPLSVSEISIEMKLSRKTIYNLLNYDVIGYVEPIERITKKGRQVIFKLKFDVVQREQELKAKIVALNKKIRKTPNLMSLYNSFLYFITASDKYDFSSVYQLLKV